MSTDSKTALDWVRATANRRRPAASAVAAEQKRSSEPPGATTPIAPALSLAPTADPTTTKVRPASSLDVSDPFAHLDPRNLPLDQHASLVPDQHHALPPTRSPATDAAGQPTHPPLSISSMMQVPEASASPGNSCLGEANPLPALLSTSLSLPALSDESIRTGLAPVPWNAHARRPGLQGIAMTNAGRLPFALPVPATSSSSAPIPVATAAPPCLTNNQTDRLDRLDVLAAPPAIFTHHHDDAKSESKSDGGGLSAVGKTNWSQVGSSIGLIAADDDVKADIKALAPAAKLSSDLTMNRWRELNGLWSSAVQQHRVKRERDEKHQRERAPPLTRLGGVPAPSPLIGQPPVLFDPSAMNMMFGLLMRDAISASVPSLPSLPSIPASAASVTTEVFRSPSGHAQQVIMMSQTSSSTAAPGHPGAVSGGGRRLFDAGSLRRPAPARMVFNDRRLDPLVQRTNNTSNPFASGNASSRWGDLFRAARDHGRAQTNQSGGGGGGGGMDSALSSILNRTLYDAQPTPSNLRNGGSTLIVLDAPPTLAEGENCPICLDNDPGQTWAQFPCCKKFGHLECTKRWLATNIRCPICRTPVP